MSYLVWPMRLGADGRFLTSSAPDSVWGGRVSQVICARMGERLMRTDYGCDLAASLFANALVGPEESVRSAVQKWLPHIKVDSVVVTQVQGSYEVVVGYTTPDQSHLTTTVGVASPDE